MIVSGDTVFVVLGESGEYSDRDVWVSAVYPTREEAEQAILTHLAQRREWENWKERYDKVLRRRPMFTNDGFVPPTRDERAAAREAAGPEPAHVRTEHAEIFEVRLGQWEAACHADA